VVLVSSPRQQLTTLGVKIPQSSKLATFEAAHGYCPTLHHFGGTIATMESISVTPSANQQAAVESAYGCPPQQTKDMATLERGDAEATELVLIGCV
jgi:hypothetical protein